MKKLVAYLLVLCMLLTITACAPKDDAELAAMQEQLAQMQQQINAQNSQPAAENTEVRDAQYVYLFHALADGQDRVAVDGETSVTAQAVIPEGMALDCWALNGTVLMGEEEDQLTFSADTTTFAEARLRPELTVSTINARMKFLDEKDEPKGEPFEQFVFEEEYQNPVTGMWHDGGTVTVYVEAVVPKGYVIDYWKINEIPYYFNRTVSSFVVMELDESTVYEVVLREEKATPTPKPTAKPDATPAPVQPEDGEEDWKPTAEPEPTPEPVMYNVTCVDCSFDGKSSGKVPAGTVITVKANQSTGDFEVNDTIFAEDTSSITLTIYADTYIRYLQEIN